MYNGVLITIIVGDDSPGKTTFIKKILTDLFVSDQKMTIGVEFYSKIVSIDGKRIKLIVWELNGQPRFRFLLSNYIKAARGGLFLYDVTDRSSIARIDDWLNVIKKGLREGDIFPILVVGIETSDKSKRQVSTEEGVKISNSKNLDGYIECNLKTGKNVEKVFEDLTRLILADTGYNPPMKAEDIKIFVDVSENTSDKVAICQEIADKLGIKNGASIEVHNPDNGKKATAVIEISNMVLDFAGQVSKNIVDSLDFMGVELILRPIN